MPTPTSSNENLQARNQAQHTRTYQACIPCRRRKVRCDLGPVDNPHEPPCVRCRRESKECFFSATRRKRKTADGSEGTYDDGELSDYEVRNGRKRPRSQPDNPTPNGIDINRASSTAYLPQPLTPGGSLGRYEPLRRPGTGHNPIVSPHNDEEDQKVNNATVATLQTGEVFSGHDALNLLFEAAGRNGDIDPGSALNQQRQGMPTGNTPRSQTSFPSPRMNGGATFDGRSRSGTARDSVLDPSFQGSYPKDILPPPPDAASFAEAVKAWNKFRFVRAGWLTAKEAIAYVDYFYIYLSPLTPIIVPDYQDHATHAKLLREEPTLTVTLLTISSRFLELTGPGAASRASAIHEKLWKYLQGMIDRLIWGQEQFGGGFCGAGQQPGSDVNPLSRKGLRTLGTVESLMLLTEWHPRALHFPPGDDGDELVPPEDDTVDSSMNVNGVPQDLYKGVGGQRIDSWLEPCWRSDRMCWMLLGNAMALAFEIGVFDETSEVEFEEANRHLSHAVVKGYFRRKKHLKDLLLVYVTQTSGRLGLTSMLPKVHLDEDLAWISPNQTFHERMAQIQREQMQMMRPDQRLPHESAATQTRYAVQDLVVDFWKRVAKIMQIGNMKLFVNRRVTRDLLKSGEYEVLLQYFQQPLHEWKQEFDRATQIPIQLKHILTIEYEYCRVYVNALALQAVVERCTHNTPMQTQLQPNMGTGTLDKDGSAIPMSILLKKYGNDRFYIKEVIDASRNILKVVVDGLFPGDYLRHAPVRTFFRIVCVAIMLLKTFALGSTEDDVAITLGLLAQAVQAIRNSIVDDVHVGNRFAELVETLTNRIRARFVRMAANGSSGVSRGASHSPPRTGAHTPVMAAPHLGPPFGGNFQHMSHLDTPAMGASTSGRATPNPAHEKALWGISSETYDPNSNNISIMPPPGFGPHGYDFNGASVNPGQFGNPGPGIGQENDPNGYIPDWLALPLDPLLNNFGAEINQTTFGPDVGGYDLLDVLLQEGGA